jgi:hypothetical protein
MLVARLYFASQILRDGRVLVVGGEYGGPMHNTTAEIYDPQTNGWTFTAPPPNVLFADSASILLPDGRVLISAIYSGITNVIYDPVADSWQFTANSLQDQNEANWVKLPDDSILSVDLYAPDGSVDGTYTERYIPSLGHWIPDSHVPVQLWNPPNEGDYEIGPSILLPNGKVLILGCNHGNYALYIPSGNTSYGSWETGLMPGGMVARDTPVALMPNGNVLCVFTQTNGAPPTFYWEYGSSSGFTSVTNPPGTSSKTPPVVVMLDLPDGTVLCAAPVGAPYSAYIYQPSGLPSPAWKPTITSITANANGSYHLTGTQLNGLSQGSVLGDDAQMDSNYPLIRLTNSATGLLYARTFNWSSTSVMTSNRTLSTEFTLPLSAYGVTSTFSLVVVANGIASDPVTFTPPVWVDFNYTGSIQSGTYNFPFKKFTNAVNAVAPNGTVFIKTAGHSAETNKITKAVRIVSPYGAASIGR